VDPADPESGWLGYAHGSGSRIGRAYVDGVKRATDQQLPTAGLQTSTARLTYQLLIPGKAFQLGEDRQLATRWAISRIRTPIANLNGGLTRNRRNPTR